MTRQPPPEVFDEAEPATLSDRYVAALGQYLTDGTEESLMEAYTLSREALSQDVPISEMPVYHSRALRELGLEVVRDAGQRDRSFQFALEYLAVYDMALRGYKKTVDQLNNQISERHRVEQELRNATAELALERDSLDAKVMQRTHELADKAEDLEHTLAHLRQTNREQAEFTYAISHDLKSPSNTIRMLAEELKIGYGHLLDAEGVELVDLTRKTAERMARLVDDVLEYSRCIEAHPQHGPVELDPIFAEVQENLRYDMVKAGARLICPLLPVVHGDRMQLKLLFQNLIANAIKFRSPYRPPLVEVTWRPYIGRKVLISVNDNGIGIAPEHVDRVFGLFQRLHSHDVYPGSGIGLTLCKRIAVNHGGNIRLKSTPGIGSSFTVALLKEPT